MVVGIYPMISTVSHRLTFITQPSRHQNTKYSSTKHVIPLATYRLARGPEIVRPEKALAGMLVIGLPLKSLSEGEFKRLCTLAE
jgi:hypothetical protein